jgi:hypothetical protein
MGAVIRGRETAAAGDIIASRGASWRYAMTSATVGGCPVDESFDPSHRNSLRTRSRFWLPCRITGRRCSSPLRSATTSSPNTETWRRCSATWARAPRPRRNRRSFRWYPKRSRSCWPAGHKPQPSMVSLDEPAHARLRKPAARAFSMKRVTAMIPTIEATTPARHGEHNDRIRSDRHPRLRATRHHRLLPYGRAGTGPRPAQTVVRVPGSVWVGTPQPAGSSRDRHQHGRLPQVPTRPGRRQGQPTRRRPND